RLARGAAAHAGGRRARELGDPAAAARMGAAGDPRHAVGRGPAARRRSLRGLRKPRLSGGVRVLPRFLPPRPRSARRHRCPRPTAPRRGSRSPAARASWSPAARRARTTPGRSSSISPSRHSRCSSTGSPATCRRAGAPGRPRTSPPMRARGPSGCSCNTCGRPPRSRSGSASRARSRGTGRRPSAERWESTARSRRSTGTSTGCSRSGAGCSRSHGGEMQRLRLNPAWVLIAPALVAIGVFFFLPVVAALALSFTDFDVYTVGDPTRLRLVGLANYRHLLAEPRFWTALGNTTYFVLVGGSLSVAVALGVALLVEARAVRLKALFRTVFLLPVVTTLVAVAVVWRFLYQPRFGLLNALLGRIGLPPIDWLGDPRWAMPALI